MTAADRMRRYRKRRRRGAIIVPLEIDWDDLDRLTDLGLLPWNEADPGEIAAAVRACLHEALAKQ